MKISQAFKLAWKSISASKMRSFLTMLGMIIGVASVITLVSLVDGVKNYILDTFAELGSNTIGIQVFNTETRRVDIDDMYQIVEDNKEIFLGVTPSLEFDYTVKKDDNTLDTTIVGASEDYLDMYSLTLSSGRFITYADIKSRYNGCVIGTYIVDELFDGKVSLGDTIKINGQLFTIIGIQDEMNDSEKSTKDDRIYIPYTNLVRMTGNSNMSSFILTTKNTDLVEQAVDIIEEFLYKRMKNDELYYIQTMKDILKQINGITGMLSSILGGIAGISLLVAGIGIMNIMLVSVVERTKEIGIRKSLGAKKRDIMSQFVIEAASISMLGGGLGILIGSLTTNLLGAIFKINASPTSGSIILAFGVSAAIGIGFGYMPANKAAKLNPIDALRSE